LLADGCVVEVDDPSGGPSDGPIRHVGRVLEFSDTSGAVRATTARPRAHTELAHPLDDVRVLDLGLGVAGPFTGRVLADLGADVIKVHALHDTFWTGTHMGLGTNRGKRSISVNLKDTRGRAVLDRLVARSDVVTTNWRPGAAARLGLDADTLLARFPALVYCNTRGYERGPRSDLPGTDQTAAALCGLEWEDGACDAGNPPLWSRSGMGDTGNAMLAAIAIVGALYHRDRTGEGQAVGTSIVNAQLLCTSYAWIHADGTPGDWKHVDAAQHGFSPFYRLYEAADSRWLFVAAVRPEHRAALASLAGAPPSAIDDDTKITEILEARLRERAAAQWCTVLDDAGVPAELVDEDYCRNLFDDDEARARGLVAQTWAGNVGRFEDAGMLVELSATPGVVARGPCLCGEHTREIMREHGFTDHDVDELAAAGVIRDAPVDHARVTS
jgi:crotonobetainyl-CoA:carnitine CoA-transferase CaiB-like acyl-CoA transferase